MNQSHREFLVKDYIELQKAFLSYESGEVADIRRKFIQILEELDPTDAYTENVYRAWWIEMFRVNINL